MHSTCLPVLVLNSSLLILNLHKFNYCSPSFFVFAVQNCHRSNEYVWQTSSYLKYQDKYIYSILHMDAVLSGYITTLKNKQKLDVSSEGPSSGVSSRDRGSNIRQ